MLPEAGSYFGTSSLKSVSQHPSLKPCFCLFQQVQDWLYLTPPSLEEHTGSLSMYLRALGFMKPVDKIVLHTIPLKSLLEWLSKTKDLNLVEATMGGGPEKALVLAATKCTLYEEDPPSMGVGLVYKLHYIFTESFCSAFMHLSVWHTAASSEDSTDRLDSACFLLVSISEMRKMVPVALLHPIFLDVSGMEVVEKTGEPLAPHWFRGFRLHTVWSRPPGEEPVHQITFPRLWGEVTAPMLEYEPEKFPPSMWQGPKIAVSLRPPSSLHWNIESNLVLTIMMDMIWPQLEAKRAARDPERESTGAEESPREMPVPEGTPPAIAGSSKAASPMETTRQGGKDLEVALGAIKHIHALRLQMMNYMGSVKEIEQAAVHTLMAEFARLRTIMWKDLTKSLSALRSELEASSKVLLANLLNVHPGDPAFSEVRDLIQRHHQSVSVKVNLPLTELEAAKEELDRFLQERLCELGSDPRARKVLEEVTQTQASYNRKVQEALLVPGMERPGVISRIMLALFAEQPMEAVLLPGILDRLSGRLGMMPPGVVDQPTSAREGFSRQWAATLREAVLTTKGREPNLDQVTPHVVHPPLHQDYELDFRRQRVDDIAPTLTSPMLAGIASNIRLLGSPVVSPGPESPKTDQGLQGHGGAPAQPAVPGPSHIGGPMEIEGEKLLEVEAINLDATIPADLPKDAADVIILDDKKLSFPGDYPKAISTPKIEVASGHKRSSEDTSPHSSPPKKRATEETVESPPPHDVSLPKGTKEKDLLPWKYEVFASDYEWVQHVRGSLLGLEANDSPSRRQIEGASRFRLWMAASEMEPPEVIAEHWLANLRNDGLLVECPPDQFTAPADWILLYTSEGLQKYLLAALSAFPSQGVPSLIAVMPPEVHVGSDQEFLLCNFHWHRCLMRQSFNIGGKCRQLAFCPYCRVINENSDTALSHLRKHLDLQFVCGGYFSRSFLNGPALNKHMRTCASVTTIRDHSNW